MTVTYDRLIALEQIFGRFWEEIEKEHEQCWQQDICFDLAVVVQIVGKDKTQQNARIANQYHHGAKCATDSKFTKKSNKYVINNEHLSSNGTLQFFLYSITFGLSSAYFCLVTIFFSFNKILLTYLRQFQIRTLE